MTPPTKSAPQQAGSAGLLKKGPATYWETTAGVHANPSTPSARFSANQTAAGTRALNLATAQRQRLELPLRQPEPEPLKTPRVAVANLGAGPAAQPESVVRQLAKDLVNFEGTGMGIMELSHRDPEGPIQKCMDETKALLSDLLDVPDDYEILLMHGGGWGQYSALPFNLYDPNAHSGTSWVVSGNWSELAMSQSQPHGPTAIAARAIKKINFVTGKQEWKLPNPKTWDCDPNSAFLHICANETVTGMEYLSEPALDQKLASVPLVADFTSTLLSRPLDVSKYGLIYASGGKNLGPSGVTAVIVQKALLECRTPHPLCPAVLNYSRVASEESRINTPATFNIHALRTVLRWLHGHGGVKTASTWAELRASMAYDVIDSSDGFYINDVDPACRSRMNVPFRISNQNATASASKGLAPQAGDANPEFDTELEKVFVREAEAAGIVQMHVNLPRAIASLGVSGGLRLSMYNALPIEDAQRVVEFMHAFRLRYDNRR